MTLQQAEEIRVVVKKQPEAFQNDVNDLLRDGWVLQQVTQTPQDDKYYPIIHTAILTR